MKRQQTITYIRELYESHGHEAYFGEEVTQWQHAAQAAFLARSQGLDEASQVAAFLHDIGHLLATSPDAEWAGLGHKDHENLGAEWLAQHGFSDKVIALVSLHVAAKRYLCTTDPDYFHDLSDASKTTFILQGGDMSAAEIAQFTENPYARDAVALRLIDDQAKEPAAPMLPLPILLEICEKQLLTSDEKTP